MLTDLSISSKKISDAAAALAKLLSGCPSLRSLELTLSTDYLASHTKMSVDNVVDAAGETFWRVQGKASTLSCLKHKLKRAEIIGFGGHKLEKWEFIDPYVEFLVKNACAHQEIPICDDDDDVVDKCITVHKASVFAKVAQQMLSYQKPSPSAVALFQRFQLAPNFYEDDDDDNDD